VQINFYNGRAIGIELPPSVVLTVVDTEPGIKNATATNTFKPARMETGITVQVPPFINKRREDQDRHRRGHLHGARLRGALLLPFPPSAA
jgi:hypothetical protein